MNEVQLSRRLRDLFRGKRQYLNLLRPFFFTTKRRNGVRCLGEISHPRLGLDLSSLGACLWACDRLSPFSPGKVEKAQKS